MFFTHLHCLHMRCAVMHTPNKYEIENFIILAHEQTSKQTNKQTNEQTREVNLTYLSVIQPVQRVRQSPLCLTAYGK